MNTTITLTRPGLRWLAAGLAASLLAASFIGAATVSTRAQSSSDDDTDLRTLSVFGTGRVKAVPDVADVNIGVTERAEEAGAASRQAAEAMDAMISAFLEMGIDEKDIQTTNLSLYAVQDWSGESPKIVGWEASNQVNVTVRDIEAVGTVVDTAVEAGANQINGVSFRVEDPTEAEALARSAAVADAQAKADQLASDAGVEIVGIVSISESGGQQPEPIYMARAEMAVGDTAAATPVLPGEVELSVSVYIKYEIA